MKSSTFRYKHINDGGPFYRPPSLRRQTAVFVVSMLLTAYVYMLPLALFEVPYSTAVYDRNGVLLGARVANDGQWRFPPSATPIASKYATCVVAFEDHRFYWHWGVDPLATARAFYQNLKHRHVVSGGSTLTMQTIRLSRRQQRRTYSEKILEMLLATRLEFNCSKAEILSLYATHAPFGGNVVGIEAAAWRYFNHAPDRLSWAEAALLAVLPNAPSKIRPGYNQDKLKQKRDALLRKLYEQQQISADEYELAVIEEMPAKLYALPQTTSHLVDYFYNHRQGHQVQTTIDANVQRQMEQVVRRWSAVLYNQQIHNMALLVVDACTGEVVAYCGNALGIPNTETSDVDIIRSRRSTGSILKPFLYCAALQDGVILPHTLLPDVPINLSGFAPQNFNYTYDGAVPADEALIRSLNVPFVLLLRQYGTPKFYNFLKQIGFSTLDRSSADYGLSLILGGAEATLWDVVQAYAKMSNTLQYLPVHNIYVDKLTQPESQRDLFSPEAVWFTFEALKELNRPEELDWRMVPSAQKIAWKTGTSFGFRDAWAVGVSSKYVVGVWTGNASGEGNVALVGARTAGPILFDAFEMLPRAKWFTQPERGMAQVVVCPQSGYLKGRFCPDGDTMLVCATGQRTPVCPYHCLGKPSGSKVQQSVFVLPPAWAWYYQKKHQNYNANAEKMSVFDDNPMQFIYPATILSHVTLPKQPDGSLGKMVFELVHEDRQATIFWHLDGNYIAQTQDFHKLSLALPKGRHRITVIDEAGNSRTIIVVVE